MSTQDRAGVTSCPPPRIGLALVCLAHAAVFGSAAALLTWRAGSIFSLVLGAMALLHAVTAALAMLRRPEALRMAWRVLSVLSLAFLAAATWVISTSALYLVQLYQGLGRALAAALIAVWLIIVLFTLPVACWGLASTWRPSARVAGRRVWLAGAGVVAFVVSTVLIGSYARARPVTLVEESAIRQLLLGSLPELPAKTTEGWFQQRVAVSLFHAAPAICPEPLDDERLTLLVTQASESGAPMPLCLQAPTPIALASGLKQALERSAPESPVKLDVISAIHHLESTHPLLDALKLRPARDGVCVNQRCLAPWQLVALDSFAGQRPLGAVPDASFGFSARALRQLLGDEGIGIDGLVRIETLSYVFDSRGLSRLIGFVPEKKPLTSKDIENAAVLAETHIVRAQQADGRFRYTLDPFSGNTDIQNLSLPRQAGTTLALCELGKRADTRQVVRRSLAMLQQYEVRVGPASAFTNAPKYVRLVETALPLVAFSTCRDVVGDSYDALLARGARFLLRMQRADGSFAPEFDLERGEPLGKHELLYGAGQALLALVLLEQHALRAPDSTLDLAEIRRAIDRGMDHYSRSYWKKPLYDFFFLEENWHCLAARAALTSHRHDHYEQFCIDYVAFKSRIILRQTDGVSETLIGGYGLSALFPPHNTATAGFGEALAAAMAVKQVRGLKLEQDRELMKDVLGFLVRAQWTERNCFACTPASTVEGGFSEHAASPIIRIDYVQHAMAALGHGGKFLQGS